MTATLPIPRRKRNHSAVTPALLEGRQLKTALAYLAAADPDLARALAQVGPPPPRAKAPGFPALLNIIVAQQVSTSSAAAIWRRLTEATAPLTPENFSRLSEGDLRALGFSRQKALYGLSLAGALLDRHLDLDALAALDDEAAIALLIRLKGIGRWSAEMYLLSCLQRPDILPADDLALMIAAQRLKGLPERPRPAALRSLSEPWRPWRSIASRLLWHYYSQAPILAAKETLLK